MTRKRFKKLIMAFPCQARAAEALARNFSRIGCSYADALTFCRKNWSVVRLADLAYATGGYVQFSIERRSTDE